MRTIIWALILFGIITFSYFNWKPVEVQLWGDIVVEAKVPAVVILSFLLGLVPMWLYHRGVKWSLDRRIRSLENSIKSTALAKRHDPAVAHGPSDETAAAQPIEANDQPPAPEPAESDPLSPTSPPSTGSESK